MRLKACLADVLSVGVRCVRFLVFQTRYLSLNEREAKIKLVYRKVRKPVSAPPGGQKFFGRLRTTDRATESCTAENFEIGTPRTRLVGLSGAPFFHLFQARKLFQMSINVYTPKC